MHWKDAHSREPWFSRSDLMVDASAVKQKVKNMPNAERWLISITQALSSVRHRYFSKAEGVCKNEDCVKKYEKDEENKERMCMDACLLRHFHFLDHPAGPCSINVNLSRTVPTHRQDKWINHFRNLRLYGRLPNGVHQDQHFPKHSSLVDLHHRGEAVTLPLRPLFLIALRIL